MKRYLIFLAFLFFKISANATETLTYFVYVQSDYLQGPWLRAESLYSLSQNQYLYPIRYDELFGTVPEQMTDAILNHLVLANPDRYTFGPHATIEGDTIVITTTSNITDSAEVKNELVTSYHFNGYPVLKLIEPGATRIYTLEDVSVPYFDLNHFSTIDTANSNTGTIPSCEVCATPNESKEKNKMIWLILSTILNIGLLILIFLRRKHSN